MQGRLARGLDVVNEQLQTALNSRVVIEQAKGALSRHLGISTEEAFEILRSRARSTRRRLSDVAADVAQGHLTDFTADSLD
jgi:AmiR/NasT family two-component response regulator